MVGFGGFRDCGCCRGVFRLGLVWVLGAGLGVGGGVFRVGLGLVCGWFGVPWWMVSHTQEP